MPPTLCHSCNVCTKLHTDMIFTIIFYTFFSGAKPRKFFLCFWNRDLNLFYCLLDTVALHCLPSLCRVRTEIELTWGGDGKKKEKERTQITPHQKNLRKNHKQKTHKPVTQNKTVLTSWFTAQQEDIHVSIETGGNKTGQLISIPQELVWNVCETDPHLHCLTGF